MDGQAHSSFVTAPVNPGKVTAAASQVEGVSGKSGKHSKNSRNGERAQRRRGVTANSATQEDQCHPRKIFIGGLAHKTTTQYLRDYFSKYGNIVDSVVLRWPDGRSRGFGYVTFADIQGAQAALQESHQVGGRQVDVKRAVPGTNKLFVGGLPQNTSAAELREHFEAFGIVSDAVVMIDPATNRSRGFGFVCFLPGQEGAASAAFALEQYEHHRLRGKWIEVKSAAPPHKLQSKEDTTPSSASASDGAGAADESPSEITKVMSLATALKAGPRVNDRPVASPQHHRQRSFGLQLQPQKVPLPGSIGTPPGLDATPAAGFSMDEAVNPIGFGWPGAAGFGSMPEWTPPSCLTAGGDDVPIWKGGPELNPESCESQRRSSVFSSTSELEKSIEQLIRSRTEGTRGPSGSELATVQSC